MTYFPPATVPNPEDVIGAISATNGTVSTISDGYRSASVVLTGTWVATVVAEVSADGGTTWTSTALHTPGASAIGVPTFYASVTVNGTYGIVIAGANSNIRLRASSYTSGPVSVRLVRSDFDGNLAVTRGSFTQTDSSGNPLAASIGSAIPASVFVMGAKDGSGNAQPMTFDSAGNLKTTTASAITPYIYNVTCASANTEYSQAMPASCKQFFLRTRNNAALKLAFTSGQSGTTYLNVPVYSSYAEGNLAIPSLTLYFQSPTAGTVVEIVCWS